MHNFVALDVDISDGPQRIITAVSAARFERGDFVQRYHTSVTPCDGLGDPTLSQVVRELDEFIDGSVVVHFGQLIRQAMCEAPRVARNIQERWDWLDAAEAARLAWPKLNNCSLDLQTCAEQIDYNFNDRNPCDNVVAIGEILIAAANELGASSPEQLDEIMRDARLQPTDYQRSFFDDMHQTFARDIIHFHNKSIIPTHYLELAKAARLQGAKIVKNNSKRTTIVAYPDGANPRYQRRPTTRYITDSEFIYLIQRTQRDQ